MQPLSSRTRHTAFYATIALFLIVTPIIIGYSTGYRWDLSSGLSLVKTGGIFIHSDQANTRVFIDDEFIESNGFILRNTLVQNLSPNKSYHVRIEKDDHFWWEKTLTVYPNLVTEGRILMLPTETLWERVPGTTTVPLDPSTLPPSQRATTSTTTLVANPQYETLVEQFEETLPQFAVEVATTTLIFNPRLGTSTASTTIVTEIQLPEYFDQERFAFIDFETKTMLRERNRVTSWLEGGNVYTVWLGEEGATPFYFCTNICKGTIVIDWVDEIRWFDFYPGRDDVLLVLNDSGLHAIELDDRSRQNIQTIYEGYVDEVRVDGNGDIILWDKAAGEFLERVE